MKQEEIKMIESYYFIIFTVPFIICMILAAYRIIKLERIELELRAELEGEKMLVDALKNTNK